MADVPLSPRAPAGPGTTWTRRYPPLATLVVALLIAFLVLPSALNLPQSSPSTVLEFAPVPPEDDTPPPPDQGSMSSLGLGTTSSLSAEITPSSPALGGPGGAGERPMQKRCVGDPPRQTEDPNSPPCVAYFDADNGGATWQGVTKDEIVVLVYTSAHNITGASEGRSTSPAAGSYCDIDGPANSQRQCLESSRGAEDFYQVRALRAMSKYFNTRFQTYDRRVHFWMYWSGCGSTCTTSGRRADASDNWERLKPFAVVDQILFGGYNQTYAESMALRKIMVFGNFAGLLNRFYRNNAPFIWTFWPDVEHWVEQYVSYLCMKVAPYPVTHAGTNQDLQMNGKPRKYAFLYTSDRLYPGLQAFADMVKRRLAEGCPNGLVIEPAVERTYPRNQYAADTHPDAPTSARTNIAAFRSEEVTTILWLAGYEVEHSKAAFAANYFPEWVLAGDLLNDQNDEARFQQQEVWRHAWVASNYLREDSAADSPCKQAFREAEPGGRNLDENEACGMYRELFMFFRGVQAAGPYLSPESVDQGNHAIPR